MLNNYNLKNKYVAILFISQLLSLSLAGYIVLVIGYLLSLSINSNYSRKIQSIVLIISSFAAFLLVCTMVWKDYSFQEAILNRLIFEDGTWISIRFSGTESYIVSPLIFISFVYLFIILPCCQ